MIIEDTYLKDSIKKCVDYVMSKNDEDKRRIITGMFQYNDYLINEQLVVKALNDEEKQEWFNNEIFETKDKEIERLNKRIEDLSIINEEHKILNEMIRKELQQKENIIKEVREYIEKNLAKDDNGCGCWWYSFEYYVNAKKELLGILDKESK